jgi:hypothetical protein
MATMVGNNGSITVNGINVANVRNFSIELTADTIETTTMGVDVRTYVSGLSSFSGSADVYFDPADYDTNETTFNPTAGLVGAAGVAGKFYLQENYSSALDYAFTGNIVVTGWTVNSTMDGLVEASMSFQGTGAATYSTTAV